MALAPSRADASWTSAPMQGASSGSAARGTGCRFDRRRAALPGQGVPCGPDDVRRAGRLDEEATATHLDRLDQRRRPRCRRRGDERRVHRLDGARARAPREVAVGAVPSGSPSSRAPAGSRPRNDLAHAGRGRRGAPTARSSSSPTTSSRPSPRSWSTSAQSAVRRRSRSWSTTTRRTRGRRRSRRPSSGELYADGYVHAVKSTFPTVHQVHEAPRRDRRRFSRVLRQLHGAARGVGRWGTRLDQRHPERGDDRRGQALERHACVDLAAARAVCADPADPAAVHAPPTARPATSRSTGPSCACEARRGLLPGAADGPHAGAGQFGSHGAPPAGPGTRDLIVRITRSEPTSSTWIGPTRSTCASTPTGPDRRGRDGAQASRADGRREPRARSASISSARTRSRSRTTSRSCTGTRSGSGGPLHAAGRARWTSRCGTSRASTTGRRSTSCWAARPATRSRPTPMSPPGVTGGVRRDLESSRSDRGVSGREDGPAAVLRRNAPLSAAVGEPGYFGTPGSIGASLKETEYLPTAVFDRSRTGSRRHARPWLGSRAHGRLPRRLNLPNAVRLCDASRRSGCCSSRSRCPPESPDEYRDLTRAAHADRRRRAPGHVLGRAAVPGRRALGVLQCDS